jgi:hypothetical protein
MYLLFVAIFGLINAGNAFDKIEAIKTSVEMKNKLLNQVMCSEEIKEKIVYLYLNMLDILYQSINDNNEIIYLPENLETNIIYTFDSAKNVTFIGVTSGPYDLTSYDEFHINSGVLTSTNNLNAESAMRNKERIPNYIFQIKIDDQKVNLTLIIIDENEAAPSFIDCTYENYTAKINVVDDDYSIDNISYSIMSGNEKFSIDNNGVIRIKDDTTFEKKIDLYSILSDNEKIVNSNGTNLIIQISDGLYYTTADVNINTKTESCTVTLRE